MSRHFGQHTPEELEEARAIATDAIEMYGDFPNQEIWDRFRSGGIWNDHVAVQAAIVAVMARNDVINELGRALLAHRQEPDDVIKQHIRECRDSMSPEQDGYAQEMALQYGFVYADDDCQTVMARTADLCNLMAVLRANPRPSTAEGFAWPSDSDCAENDQLSRVCEKLEEVMDDRDEADRRAGAAERHTAEVRREVRARREWLRKAKQEAGYEDDDGDQPEGA